MHLVLDRSKKLPRFFGARVIINAESINFQNLAIEDFFRGTDVANSGKQFIEIIASPSILQ